MTTLKIEVNIIDTKCNIETKKSNRESTVSITFKTTNRTSKPLLRQLFAREENLAVVKETFLEESLKKFETIKENMVGSTHKPLLFINLWSTAGNSFTCNLHIYGEMNEREFSNLLNKIDNLSI